FSDFPKGNTQIFALRRRILLRQNPQAINDRPYGMDYTGIPAIDSSSPNSLTYTMINWACCDKCGTPE
ncbi:MAG: hypothetical protein IJX04_06725, partial [Oscillospiraceae bacterium]|nr:hypothetical protein [Oscillospiraceae bacterium]